jgi:hypothetical protein
MALSLDRSVGIGGVAIGLVGSGIVLLWPEKRWLGWVFISMGLLVALVAIVWALAVSHARKELEGKHSNPAPIPAPQMPQSGIDFKPHIEVKPVFNHSQLQERPQEQSISEAKTVPPQLECADRYFIQGILSSSNRLVSDAGIRCMVAQADFYLKPIPGSDPWIELRTQLLFYDKDGSQPLKRVSDGMWRETVNHIQMPLNTGDTRQLVVALYLGDAGFHTYKYAERPSGRPRFNVEGVFHHNLVPELDQLNVSELTVQVLLSGKYLNNVTLNKEVWFKLSSKPDLAIEQIASPRGVETDMKTNF